MRSASNEGVEIAYEVDGPAEAETVIFAAGLGYGRWMWHWQQSALDDYRTIVWDNRGAGDSDVPEGPYTIAEMASDMEAVLADDGTETAHVVGASMGGMIALSYALDYDRTRSLSLLCTSPGGDDAIPMPSETRSQVFDVPDEYDDRERIRYKMRPAMSEGFYEDHETVVEQIVDWRVESDASEQARDWQAAAVSDFDVADELGEIQVPTLVMHGTADRVLPPGNSDLLAERLPDVQDVRVEGGPHLFFIECADVVTEHLRGFLADV